MVQKWRKAEVVFNPLTRELLKITDFSIKQVNYLPEIRDFMKGIVVFMQINPKFALKWYFDFGYCWFFVIPWNR
jgi:hypothetical protein